MFFDGKKLSASTTYAVQCLCPEFLCSRSIVTQPFVRAHCSTSVQVLYALLISNMQLKQPCWHEDIVPARIQERNLACDCDRAVALQTDLP